MGLFGGGSVTTKTKVAPAKNVENLLRDIVNQTNNMDVGGYINRQVAGMTPDQQAALSALTENRGLNQAMDLYRPLTEQGLSQTAQQNQQLQDFISGRNAVTGGDVNAYRNATLSNATSRNALNQGVGASGALASLGGGSNDALRRTSAQNTANISALTNNARGQQAAAQGASNLYGNRQAQLGNLGMQSAISGQNIGLGQNVANLSQTAMGNALAAGQQEQAQANLEAQNTWANALGQNQFAWNQLNNKLNVLNTVSPMAGYTTVTKGANPAGGVGQQILGAATTGLGIYGSLGGFNGTGAQNAQGEYKNQWFNQGGTGMFNGLGSLFGGGNS